MGGDKEKKADIIVYDVGSTYTKISAFARSESGLVYLGRSQAPTTIDNIINGLQNAKYNLLTQGEITNGSREIYATSSAAGGLRMVAMGYMPRVTAKAAKEVAMTAGARVLEIVSYEDQPDFRVEVLREINPDIILLAGGTDGGDQESLIQNAMVIVESRINTVVIIAGNAQAQPQVESILHRGGVQTVRVANVMPNIHELNVKPARKVIHEQFIAQITRAKGLSRLLETVSNGQVIPTPGAVLLGTELLALGTSQTEGLGDVVVVDIGGATTDVHSVLPSMQEIPNEEKGLVVSQEKQVSFRTVEGNLGMRVSAAGILEVAGAQAILAKVGLSGKDLEKELVEYTSFLEKNQEHIAMDEMEKKFDQGMAIVAMEVALKRHAGFLAREYDPVMGVAPGTPVGRDLRRVKNVICIGGIFTHSPLATGQWLLGKAMEHPGVSLLPRDPGIIVDKDYLMYAIGVLGQIYPEETMQLAKKYFAANLERGN